MNYPHFPESEFAGLDPPCAGADMNMTFMERLEALRDAFGQPLPLTCAYRSPAHEKAKGRSGTGAHTLGRAVDVSIRGTTSWDVLRLLILAQKLEFAGIGLYPTWVHLDDAPHGEGRVRPAFWWPK